jgi:hypothetical protein
MMEIEHLRHVMVRRHDILFSHRVAVPSVVSVTGQSFVSRPSSALPSCTAEPRPLSTVSLTGQNQS